MTFLFLGLLEKMLRQRGKRFGRKNAPHR